MTIDVQVTGEIEEIHRKILIPNALQLAGQLHQIFNPIRLDRLADRKSQAYTDSRVLPGFDPETTDIRQSDYRAAPIPKRLLKRTSEITGPAGDRKGMINRLNAKTDDGEMVKVDLECLEDAQCPLLKGILDGQVNLYDAVRRTISYTKKDGKHYELGDTVPEIFVRPRGWHMVEKNITVDGEPISASILDATLFLYHNAHELTDQGSGPNLYLAKMKHWKEAELWNAVLDCAEEELGLEQNAIKTTFLNETLYGTLHCDEMIHAMKDRCVGVNFGRWDWLFDWIKTFHDWEDKVLPDRDTLTMDKDFLQAASGYMVQTAHRRGILAIDGMSAQIPIKGDPAANEAALAKVQHDKERGKALGHDGAWLAHPWLLPMIEGIYADVETNQLHVKRDDVTYFASDFMEVPPGDITENGIRNNIAIIGEYLSNWLCGTGSVAINHLMEDTATCEIPRVQITSYIHNGAKMDDGRVVTKQFIGQLVTQEMTSIYGRIGKSKFIEMKYPRAQQLMLEMLLSDSPPDFLTTFCYDYLE